MRRFDWIEFYCNQRMIVITFMFQQLEVEKLNDKKRKLKVESFRPIPSRFSILNNLVWSIDSINRH